MSNQYSVARQHPSPAFFLRVLLLLVMMASLLPAPAPALAAVQNAPAVISLNTFTLQVVSARTEPRAFDGAGVIKGDPVSSYKYIINLDNSGNPYQERMYDCYPEDALGNPNPNYPESCQWPSIVSQPGFSPIIEQGSEVDLNLTSSLTLPDGTYLISVLADGYKLDGVQITLPMVVEYDDANPAPTAAPVTVEVQPLPLPAGNIRVKVFLDDALTNGQPDIPAEGGLEGFRGLISDTGGLITVDVFGNPLCTVYEKDGNGNIVYDVDGTPIIDPNFPPSGGCFSDANGDLLIPNIGPNRYAVSVVPPDGQLGWLQTTTLEGNLDWDTWVQEGYSGLDNEFLQAAEPFPWTIFGFIQARDEYNGPETGGVEGHLVEAEMFYPLVGGLPYQGGIWGGLSGAKITGPITNGYVALNDLQEGDRSRYVAPADENGYFRIDNVPDGNYSLTWWDENLFHIVDWKQVTVSNGQITDMGNLFLTPWFAKISGTVFLDTNENGRQDPGEQGVSDVAVVVKRRENTSIDRGAVGAVSDTSGHYLLENVYPLTQWAVIEAYSDLYYTTGVTFQATNQPTETTILGAGVDVNALPIIGQSGRLDWGVKPYAPGTNGGIVGSVVYDVVRNELDARYAAVEGVNPGIPNMRVNLYATVKNPDGSFVIEPDGSYRKGDLLNWTLTETWARPTACTTRDADGNEIQMFLLPPNGAPKECIESPQTGLQFGTEYATVDGNYGFGTMFTGGAWVNDEYVGGSEVVLPVGDYLVEVVSPTDLSGDPIYTVTREEDVNVFNGDSFVPNVPPPACVGALHTVTVTNPAFIDAGGSPYEGMQRPLCDVKLVSVQDRKSIAPLFTFFTEVPIPGRWFLYIIDDLTLSTNPQDLMFGEKAGIPLSPIGIYDFSGRLVRTVYSDPNGVADVLLPSTGTYNCPTPTGVCSNLYRIVGNDPGQPGRPNRGYNPLFRTISASFEIFPGSITPADLAPTQIGVTIQGPGSQFNAVTCKLAPTQPQLFAISPKPYLAETAPIGDRLLTIEGQGFGATQGAGMVSLGTTILPVTSWTDRHIVVTIPEGMAAAPYQLMVQADNGQKMVNGLTFHILGAGYNPEVYEVDGNIPTGSLGLNQFNKIQDALEAAAADAQALVVVYPGLPELWNPGGIYYENIVIHSPVKLQGVGPGGVYEDPTPSMVPGSTISGLGFGGDTDLANQWRTLVSDLQDGAGWDGNQVIYEGQVVYILAQENQFTANFKAAIDGFIIEGGDQMGFPNNLNEIWGLPTGIQPNAINQGGGIFANAYVRHLQITNNILQSNGGAYGGAIRLGTAHLTPASNFNENVRILNNRIIANGGTNLAGGVALFAGSDNYEIANNDICANFSAEYGGGISHYGFSPNGSIHDNRIWFNRSYDEGGGIMIAGELPADTNILSPGSGPVNIYNNLIQANLANDDGGGLRFLMAGNFEFNVFNNIIVNNVSTHEGGGIGILDTPDIRIFNNTIMKNITTATAVTSNGLPAPAGLSTVRNSNLLQATLPAGAPLFSKPLLFNNIFSDNRAGSSLGGNVSGIGIDGDPSPINLWDLGVADYTGVLEPMYSFLNDYDGNTPHPSNIIAADPLIVLPYDLSVAVYPWRGAPTFISAFIVAVEAPAGQMGDYTLQSTSPAVSSGASFVTYNSQHIFAPRFDIQNEGRPMDRYFEMGADELTGLFYTFIPTTLR